MTFISYWMRSLPDLTMFDPVSIEMIQGVPLMAKVLQKSLVML